MAYVCSLFADSEFFGAAMGISESFLSLGWIVGPLLGGYTADVAGFAAPFILTGGLALLATPVLYFLMPEGKYACCTPHRNCYVCSPCWLAEQLLFADSTKVQVYIAGSAPGLSCTRTQGWV